jgi:hypothetical protein
MKTMTLSPRPLLGYKLILDTSLDFPDKRDSINHPKDWPLFHGPYMSQIALSHPVPRSSAILIRRELDFEVNLLSSINRIKPEKSWGE